jgi:hypothetical protein
MTNKISNEMIAQIDRVIKYFSLVGRQNHIQCKSPSQIVALFHLYRPYIEAVEWELSKPMKGVK